MYRTRICHLLSTQYLTVTTQLCTGEGESGPPPPLACHILIHHSCPYEHTIPVCLPGRSLNPQIPITKVQKYGLIQCPTQTTVHGRWAYCCSWISPIWKTSDLYDQPGPSWISSSELKPTCSSGKGSDMFKNLFLASYVQPGANFPPLIWNIPVEVLVLTTSGPGSSIFKSQFYYTQVSTLTSSLPSSIILFFSSYFVSLSSGSSLTISWLLIIPIM